MTASHRVQAFNFIIFTQLAATSQNLSLQIIGRLLGHKNPATTNRYADLQDDPAKQAAEVIGRRITQAMKTENAR
jgi:hypothetical protein